MKPIISQTDPHRESFHESQAFIFGSVDIFICEIRPFLRENAHS